MNYLIIVTGPTGIGKTNLSIQLAKQFSCEIISADSRQIYKEMRIGTAVPSQKELEEAKHHLISHVSIHDYYNVSRYEDEAIALIQKLHQKNKYIILTGGTGLYIDAVCQGIDAMPDPDIKIRESLNLQLKTKGLESLQKQLLKLDPDYYKIVDLNNSARLIRALEICQQTGQPYSSFRKRNPKARPFRTIKIALNMKREDLYDRINKRVLSMVEDGLIDEAKKLYPYKKLTALKTVGYKELFDAFEGKHSVEKAIEYIQNSSRMYARKQISWIRRDKEYQWFDPNQLSEIIDFVKKNSCESK